MNMHNKPKIEVDPTKISEHLRGVQYGKHQIVSRECKHATYSRDRTGQEFSDMLTVKEWITLDNGIRVPNIRLIKDYKRPYWVTKPPLRTHPEKVEFEDLKNVDMFKSTQIDLPKDICFRLGYGNPRNPVRMLARSPYLYGLDVGSEAFVKQSYFDRWPDGFTPNDVTVVDVETCMFSDFQKPILWSRVTDDGVYLYVSKEYSKGIPNYEDHVRNEYHQAMGPWLDLIRDKLRDRNGNVPWYVEHVAQLPLHIVTFDDHYEITENCIKDVHASHTDILTGWNVIYDMMSLVQSCQAVGKDPTDLLSDAKVPNAYRSAFIREGKN